MRTSSRTAYLVPGFANYAADALERALRTIPDTAPIMNEINAAAAVAGEPPPFAPGNRITPANTEYAVAAASIARYRADRHDLRREVLLGHSTGHATALTCAGVLSVADLTRMLIARDRALSALRPDEQGMACIGASAAYVETNLLIDADSAVIACQNSPNQTVISAPIPALRRIRAQALDAELLYRRLSTPYAFHTPWALPAAQVLLGETSTIEQHPLPTSVYSATRGAMCTDDDDLIADVALDLVREVRFRAALEFLAASGVRTFVDCGPTQLLLRMAADTLPDATADGDTLS